VQLHELAAILRESLRDSHATARTFDFRHLVLRHHASTGHLEGCLDTLLAFTRHSLVPVTPVTEVGEDNRLCLFWLSATMPPTNPTHVSFRCAPANAAATLA
jgi:hypothetical protein